MPSTELRDLRALLLHRDRWGSDADVGTKRAAKHRVGEWPSTRHPLRSGAGQSALTSLSRATARCRSTGRRAGFPTAKPSPASWTDSQRILERRPTALRTAHETRNGFRGLSGAKRPCGMMTGCSDFTEADGGESGIRTFAPRLDSISCTF